MTASDNQPTVTEPIDDGQPIDELEDVTWSVEDDPEHGDESPLNHPSGTPIPLPRLRENLSQVHVFGLAISAVVIAAFALFDILPWWIVLASLAVAMTTLVDGWQKVTRVGALLVAAFFLVNVVSSLTAGSSAETVFVTPTDPAPVDLTPEAGSLGFFLDDLPELWNTVDTPPRINRGLTRQSEVGEYDTFVYRFGNQTQVAGAFDPADEAVYALLVSGPFDNPATSQLYLHLCYVVAPFSQECIDSYVESGLDGGTLGDFTDQVREAEWTLGSQTWRLEIGQNLLAIRVYGEDAS
jgi:hypothetical protein